MEKKIKVLIPTDFTVQGDFAYVMVKNLAKKLDIEVTFLHILNVPHTVSMDENGNVETCGEIDVNYVVKQKEMAEQKLREIVNTTEEPVNTALVFGKTTTGIIEYAESNHFDLIAMGTKGASGLTERIVGSEAQVIARKSSVPVLSLMCDRSDLQLKKILLVHDFSENSNQGLDLLIKFIQVFDTEVHLLQIVDDEVNDKSEIIQNMQTFARNNGIENFEYHILVDQDIEKGVIHFNQMNNMDLVCIGTHGKGGFFHSSAAESLINHMYKPVISYQLK